MKALRKMVAVRGRPIIIVSQINEKHGKLHESIVELFAHPKYSSDLVLSDFFLSANGKKIIAGKKFRQERAG